MLTETRSIKLEEAERAQDFQANYRALANDVQFLQVLKGLCGVSTLDFISADKLLVTVASSSHMANNHAVCAVETAVRNLVPGRAYAMLLCSEKEIYRLTNGTYRFKMPQGVSISLGVPAEPYQRQPVFVTSADNAVLYQLVEQFRRAQHTTGVLADTAPQRPTATAWRWFGNYEVRSIEDQLEPLLWHLRTSFHLKPRDLRDGGTCFFRQWGLAVYGSSEEGARVRHDVIMTIWTSPDLQAAAGGVAMARGMSVEDYLRVVETDLLFAGSELEVLAAARRENCRVTLFVADVPEVRSLHLPGPTPPSQEVSLLTFQGRFWLLDAERPMPMDIDGGMDTMQCQMQPVQQMQQQQQRGPLLLLN